MFNELKNSVDQYQKILIRIRFDNAHKAERLTINEMKQNPVQILKSILKFRVFRPFDKAIKCKYFIKSTCLLIKIFLIDKKNLTLET